MKIVNIKNVLKKEFTDLPLFTGKITRQSPLNDLKNSELSVDYINFSKGVHNKLHVHSNDQVLIVTKGQGIIATEKKEFKIKEGDVVWVPAGEKHWHGAAPGVQFTHISITKAHSKLTQFEK